MIKCRAERLKKYLMVLWGGTQEIICFINLFFNTTKKQHSQTGKSSHLGNGNTVSKRLGYEYELQLDKPIIVYSFHCSSGDWLQIGKPAPI